MKLNSNIVEYSHVKSNRVDVFNVIFDEKMLQNIVNLRSLLILSLSFIILSLAIVTSTMYFIGHVTLFFANNYLTEYRITMKFLHIFFTPCRNF